jgi:hypothetical protein
VKVAISSFLILLTVACTSDHADNKKLVGQIEQSIKLPKGALEIQAYARYYARKGNTVYASYIVEQSDWREVVRKECSLQAKGYPCNDPNYGVIEAGQRRWVEKRDYLPFMNGGGCNYVDIEYDVERKSFSTISCSGSY